MKIKRFNENIKEERYIDPKEVCPECGAISMHLYDYSPFYISDKFVKDGEIGMNFDDNFYGSTVCDNCGYRDSIGGYIQWDTPSKMEKRKEYIEMYKKGISPVEIEKINL